MKKILTKRPKDYIFLTKEFVKWEAPENSTESGTLKQHGFVKVDRQYSTSRLWYKANMSLCGKIGIHDGDKFVHIDEVPNEELNELIACKSCANAYSKLPSFK